MINWIYLEIFLTLFIMINPIGIIPPYLSMTKGLQINEKRKILFNAIIFSFIVLNVAYFLGGSILKILGISSFSLQIAGGILFFKFGYETMTGKQISMDDNDKSGIGLVPLGFPLIAGPGSITTLILLNTQLAGISIIVPVIVLTTLLVTFVSIYFSDSIHKFLGQNATDAIVKIMGLLIISLGIQLILSGLDKWLLSITFT